MKFGKIEHPDTVTFELPPVPERTLLMLQQQQPNTVRLYIGCTGWYMKEWVGKWYPAGCKPTEYLKAYGRNFNTIELNTTHYRVPSRQVIQNWVRDTPPDFRFCPKIPQSISHSKELGAGKSNLADFCTAVGSLGAKLGLSFLQLPPTFDISRQPVLEAFFKRLPPWFSLAVEFRHPSWFSDKAAFENLAQTMEKRNISMVITDVAGRRDVLHQRLTTPTAFIRFVGNGGHPTDYKRIDDWVDRLVELQKQGLQEVYFFPHQPDNILAPELSLYLSKSLQTASIDAHWRSPRLQEPGTQTQLELF